MVSASIRLHYSKKYHNVSQFINLQHTCRGVSEDHNYGYLTTSKHESWFNRLHYTMQTVLQYIEILICFSFEWTLYELTFLINVGGLKRPRRWLFCNIISYSLYKYAKCYYTWMQSIHRMMKYYEQCEIVVLIYRLFICSCIGLGYVGV